MHEPSAAAVRQQIYGGRAATLPQPIGKTTLRLDHGSMMYVEDRLDGDLDALNLRIVKGIGPVDPDTGEPTDEMFRSVWDALEALANRSLSKVSGVLLAAQIQHSYPGATLDQRLAAASADIDRLPPAWYNDEALIEQMMRLVSQVWGQDPDAPPDPPEAPVADQTRSTGSVSSPSGPPPPPPAG